MDGVRGSCQYTQLFKVSSRDLNLGNLTCETSAFLMNCLTSPWILNVNVIIILEPGELMRGSPFSSAHAYRGGMGTGNCPRAHSLHEAVGEK